MQNPAFVELVELVETLRDLPPEAFERTPCNAWKWRAFARTTAPHLPGLRATFARRGLDHLLDEALDDAGNLDPSRMVALVDAVVAVER